MPRRARMRARIISTSSGSAASGVSEAAGGVWARATMIGAPRVRHRNQPTAHAKRNGATGRVWRRRPPRSREEDGSAGASGQEAEGALVFDARALLVPVGRIELAQEIVDLVVAALDAVEPLERGPGPARVAAPGHELTGPLERLGVVGLYVEQRPIGPQGHGVTRHRQAAPPDLAQHARIAWARAHEALPLPERGLAGPRPVVELGQCQARGHRVVAVSR